MNCEKIQELILTDYADNQMPQEQKSQLEKHLAGCIHCREFAQVVQAKVLQPFELAERLAPAESVWNKIKEELTEEEVVPKGSFREFVRFIGSLQTLRYAAYLFSVIIVLMSLTVLTVKRTPDKTKLVAQTTTPVTVVQNEVQEEFPIEQYGEEYLAYMVEEFEGNYASYNDGYGTAIEEYFL